MARLAKGLAISIVLLLLFAGFMSDIGNRAAVSQKAEQAIVLADSADVENEPDCSTAKPQNEKSVNITKTTRISIDAKSEGRMFEMINDARKSHGLKPLEMDSKLRDLARKHSKDMFVNGYFAHVGPDKLTPFDRMREAGIKYIVAGENLAFAPNALTAQNGLMKSATHRDNILNSNFKKVGIGVYSSEVYGKMWTQEFTN